MLYNSSVLYVYGSILSLDVSHDGHVTRYSNNVYVFLRIVLSNNNIRRVMIEHQEISSDVIKPCSVDPIAQLTVFCPKSVKIMIKTITFLLL